MANNVEINLKAKTTDFDTGLDKAVKSLDNFAKKGGDADKAITSALKHISEAAKNNVDNLQQSMARFNVNSDLKININLEVLAKAKDAVTSLFNKIESGATSIAETTAALNRMNAQMANLDSHQTRGQFKDLGILSEASIEAMKIKAVSAFAEIERSGVATPNDIVRAHEAMTAKIEELNTLTVTQAEKTAAARINIAHEEALAEIKTYEEAVLLNQKFEYEKQRAAEKTAAARIAAYKEAAAAERASYAAQGMSGSGASAGLIGQPLAGADFGNRLKAQMEEAAVLAQTRSREMASYAASAMQGEAAAAKIVGQTQAGAGFAAQLKAQMEETVPHVEKMQHGMSGFSLASVAAIAKVQIMYSIINSIMSTIASIPKIAIDAIETFNASVVKNAATITSMSGNTKDIGKAYQENKVYAEAVQNVLVKMDAESIASYKQLQLMNDAFVQQGVFIDINNQKQVQGYKNIANALATMSAGMQNPDMQFSQEVRGLMNAEDKPTNQLFRTLKAIDPELKNHILQWKQIAAETGNAGYVLEKLGPLLVGYAAASGDIDSLWTTIKSTLGTIRDDIFRGGLKEGFTEIVNEMKEIAKYAEENKEKIQAFLQDGFQDAKKAAKFIWDIRDGFKLLSEAALYVGAAAGIASITTKLIEMYKVIAAGEIAAKGGLLLKTLTNPVAMATVAVILGGGAAVKKASENSELQAEAENVKRIAISMTDVWNREAMKRKLAPLNASHMAEFYKQNPSGDAAQAAMYFLKGGASLVPNRLSGGSDMYSLQLDKARMDFILANQQEAIKPPKAPKGGGEKETAYDPSKYNSFIGMFNSMLDNNELDTYESKLRKIDTQIMNLKTAFDSMSVSEQKSFLAFQKKMGFEGNPFKWIEDGLKNKLNTSEEQEANGFADKLNKAFSKSEATELQKKLAAINSELKAQLDSYKKLDSHKKSLLSAKGVTVESITEGYNAIKAQAEVDFHEKINKELTAQEVAVLKVAKSYKEATLEAIAFENAQPQYQDMSLAEKARKFLNDNKRFGQAANKDAGEYNKNQTRIDREQLKIQGVIGGDNYGSKFGVAENAYADEDARIKEHYENVINLQAEATAEQLAMQRQMYQEMANNDAIYAAKKNEIGLLMASDSLNIAKQAFAGNKAMSITLLALETAIAIARIMMNAEVAKSAAIASAAMYGPLSPAMAAAATASITAGEYISIGMVTASAAIQGMQIAGKRALGGPVLSGSTYLVGERGPELFTPGASGVITPNDRMNGSATVNQNINIDARGADASVLARIQAAMKQAKEEAKAEILNSMNRGGEFALASGRIR